MPQKISRKQMEDKLYSRASVRKTKGKRKHRRIPSKVCGLCWRSVTPEEAVPFPFDILEFYTHPDCKLIWEKAQELILSDQLHHGVDYPDKQRHLLQLHVNKFFFEILLWYAPESLIHSTEARKYLG